MISFERLEQIETVCSRIREVQKALQSVYNTYQSPRFDGIKYTSQPADPTSKAFYEAQRLSQELDELLKVRQDFEEELMKADCEIQAIIRYRYLIGLSWKETSMKVFHTQSYFLARDKLRWYLSPPPRSEAST